MYQAINNPVNYGGLELKTASSSHLPHSVCLTKNILKNSKIAAGGCAMIIVGDVPVGKSTFEKLSLIKKALPIIRSLPGSFIRKNCRICAQLHQSDSNMLAMLKYVPGVLSKKNHNAATTYTFK